MGEVENEKETVVPARRRRDPELARRGRERMREGTIARALTPKRGKKRRPVQQEPRAVSSKAPPQRRAAVLPEVEEFLKTNDVRCQRIPLKRTFRGITYAKQNKKDSARSNQTKRTLELALKVLSTTCRRGSRTCSRTRILLEKATSCIHCVGTWETPIPGSSQ